MNQCDLCGTTSKDLELKGLKLKRIHTGITCYDFCPSCYGSLERYFNKKEQ